MVKQPSSESPSTNIVSHLENSEHQQNIEVERSSTHQWQRVSPIALIYFVIFFIKSIFGNIIYLAPALLIGYNKITEDPSFWLPVVYGLAGIIALSALLSFYFFQYRLSNQQIEIRSGVFAKKHINLPFSRIQNVELTEPLYYRPFNYTCMQLDTAGSAKQEAKIVALNKTFAEQLKAEILAAHHQQDTANATAENASIDSPARDNGTEQEVVIDTRNLDDLVIHGLTNNRIWIFIGGLAPFVDQLTDKLGQWLLVFGFNVEQYFEFEGKSGWQIASTALSLALMIMIPLTLFSIIGSIIAFHNFTLSRAGDRYIRRSGLFTRNEVTMRLSRLQMIIRQQDWLDVILGRINLKFEQSNANVSHNQPGQLSNKIIVPSVTKKECQKLIDNAYPDNNLSTITYQRVSIRLLMRNLLVFLLPISLVAGWLVNAHQHNEALMLVIVGSGILGLLMLLRYLRWGFAQDDNFIYVRKGCIGVDYYCFPIYKVQQTAFKQSWFLKRKHLCSIQFVLASGSIDIPYLTEKNGAELIDNCLYQVESSKRNWM